MEIVPNMGHYEWIKSRYQWPSHKYHGDPYHWQVYCLFNSLFRLAAKKESRLPYWPFVRGMWNKKMQYIMNRGCEILIVYSNPYVPAPKALINHRLTLHVTASDGTNLSSCDKWLFKKNINASWNFCIFVYHKMMIRPFKKHTTGLLSNW